MHVWRSFCCKDFMNKGGTVSAHIPWRQVIHPGSRVPYKMRPNYGCLPCQLLTSIVCVHICFSSPEGFGIRLEEETFLQSYYSRSFQAWSMFHVCGGLDSTKFSPSVWITMTFVLWQSRLIIKSKYSTCHHNRELYLFWDNFQEISRHRNNRK